MRRRYRYGVLLLGCVIAAAVVTLLRMGQFGNVVCAIVGGALGWWAPDGRWGWPRADERSDPW